MVPPRITGRHAVPALVRVGEAVQHEAQRHVGRLLVCALPFVKDAGLDIPLALARAQIDIPPPAALNHAPGDEEVLVLVPVTGQVRPVLVPL